MTTDQMDAPLLERTDPGLARPLPPGLAAARADVLAAGEVLAGLPVDALTKPWDWIGGSEEEVRYGAYRAAEAIELAEVDARSMLAADRMADTRAARIVGPATTARWDLHGLLLPLADARLDADPGQAEWTIRLAMGHVISGQRGYAWGSAWWLEQGYAVASPDLPAGIPDAMWTTLPDEATTEAAGTSSDLRARLDAILDRSTERLAGLPDARLELWARWSGFPVTIGFRLGRWASHIREHTIQIEKTMAMIGEVPDEPARLARLVLAAYGRAEAAVFGRRPSTGRDAAVARLAAGAQEARAAIGSAAEAARVSR